MLCQLSYVGPFAGLGSEVVGREGFEPPCLSDLVYSQASRRCSTDPRLRHTGSRLRLVMDPATGWIALEPTAGLEPETGGLQNRCSTN